MTSRDSLSTLVKFPKRVTRAFSERGAVASFREAFENPAATYHYLFSSGGGHQMLPKHRFERPPTPTELVQFVDRLGIEAPREAVIDAWLDLYDDVEFLEEITESFRSTTAGPDSLYHNWRDFLYVLVRVVRPDLVVETGVRGGLSSAYVLCALEHNGQGRLVSIDIGDTSILPGDLPERRVGWIVPPSLRHRWELRIGDSREQLPAILDDDVDVFFSDVPNSILNEEFSLAAERLSAGAIVVSSYPHESPAESIWRSFETAALDRTATATRWASHRDESILCAGVVRAESN